MTSLSIAKDTGFPNETRSGRLCTRVSSIRAGAGIPGNALRANLGLERKSIRVVHDSGKEYALSSGAASTSVSPNNGFSPPHFENFIVTLTVAFRSAKVDCVTHFCGAKGDNGKRARPFARWIQQLQSELTASEMAANKAMQAEYQTFLSAKNAGELASVSNDAVRLAVSVEGMLFDSKSASIKDGELLSEVDSVLNEVEK